MELNIDNPEGKTDKKNKIKEVDLLISEQSNNLKNINDTLILSLSGNESHRHF